MDFRMWAEYVNPSQHFLFDNVPILMTDSTESQKRRGFGLSLGRLCWRLSREFWIPNLFKCIGCIYLAYNVVIFPYLKYVPIFLYKDVVQVYMCCDSVKYYSISIIYWGPQSWWTSQSCISWLLFHLLCSPYLHITISGSHCTLSLTSSIP